MGSYGMGWWENDGGMVGKDGKSESGKGQTEEGGGSEGVGEGRRGGRRVSKLVRQRSTMLQRGVSTLCVAFCCDVVSSAARCCCDLLQWFTWRVSKRVYSAACCTSEWSAPFSECRKSDFHDFER